MSRKLKLISDDMGALLIAQAAHELKNFILYSSFSNYYSLEGLEDLATYFARRAREEEYHHAWILKYMNDADCRMMYPAIPVNVEQKITSPIDPFIATVNREIETTQMIYKIKERADLEKDYLTENWLQQLLIPEQTEEENTSRVARAIMEMDGDILFKATKVLRLLDK